MDTTTSTTKLTQEAKMPTPRRAAAASPQAQQERRNFSGRSLLWVALALILGIALGALVTRQRYHAREQEVVVAINGATIRKDEFYHQLERAAGGQVLRQMLNDELTLQFAKKQGVYPTDAEVEAKYAEASKQPKFAETMAGAGVTPEEFKHSLRVGLARAAGISKGQTVTDAEVRRFYETNTDKKNPKARYYTPETAQFAVIVTQTEAEAKKAFAALNLGRSFADVAKNYSKDSSRDRGGALPPTQRGRTQLTKIPDLENAVFKLKIGEQMGPSKFIGAWWIIRCLDKKPAVTQPFEKVKEECRTGALLTKGLPANSAKLQKEFEEFQKQSNVQAFWPQYKEVVRVK